MAFADFLADQAGHSLDGAGRLSADVSRSHEAIQPSSKPWAAMPYVAAAFLLLQLAVVAAGLRSSLSGKVDFRAFYAAGQLVEHGAGHTLYNYPALSAAESASAGASGRALPFLYPPYAALLFAPFSLLPYRAAFVLFALLNAVLLADLVRWLMRDVARVSMPAWVRVGLAFCFVPATMALLQGQISILLLACYAGAFHFLHRDRPFGAGLLIALALFKFQIALPVIVLLSYWRKWRCVGGFLCGAAIEAGLSVLVAGVAGIRSYAAATFQIAHQTLTHAGAAKAAYGMYPLDMPNLHGAIFALLRSHLAGEVLLVAASVAVMGVVARRSTSPLAALLAGMLVSYHMQAYDLTLLILPFAICIRTIACGDLRRTCQGVVPGIRSMTRQAWAVAVALAILLPPIGYGIVMLHASIAVLAVAVLLWVVLKMERSGELLSY